MTCRKNKTEIKNTTLAGGAIGAVAFGLPGMVAGGILGSLAGEDDKCSKKRKK